MLHNTKAIVLRTVKYGETSVIVLLFTEKFGIQSYLVNGVRTSTSKGSGKANLFQPSALLDIVAYHNELKQLQRLREFRWNYLYEHVFSDIKKNAVAMLIVELLLKCLKQPESNADLFHFAEDAFMRLDKASETVTANFPLFFILHLAIFFGIRINDNYSSINSILDLREGIFIHERPSHPDFIEGQFALITSKLLKVMQPEELEEIRLNQESRRILLFYFEKYYAIHLQDFGTMKSLPVLKEILS